ncbi:DUF1259 domain-containing protein [Streptomyces cynarae]|uniref:DUF1259 domain-containing protein n=1 Tax=Streptomyces cynarae TaxID=2981134 RepID=A0ABY6DTA2_9ACTN|nr:DUF1259 domain-containing protein [Streptomyces cynarae]UXY17596.1 DUF1259 domain-containing protein [Streptomyces cynarae]
MSRRSHVKPLAGTAAALLLVAGSGLLVGCGTEAGDGAAGSDMQAAAARTAMQGQAQQPLQTTAADWQSLAAALGRTGTVMKGTVYRVPLPRKDLTVTTQGITIKPGLALGGYATFAKYHDGTMLMGDLVVTEDELPKVTDALQAAGIGQTALHKHLLQQSPAIWWTHVHAMGNPVALAKGLKSALAATAIPPASPPPATQPSIDLDTAGIDKAIGRKGTADGGIYKFSIPRKNTVTDGMHVLPSALGITTGINFQPLGGNRAAINGDFVMTAPEVQQVIRALRKGGTDIVELHNHSLNDQPRLFYMHFWATGDGVTLTKALRPALNATALAPAS